MRFSTRLGPAFRFGWMTALALLAAQSSSGGTRQADEKRVGERISGVRIPFIANSGQTDPAVAYYAPTFAGTVFVTRDGRIVYSLPGEKASGPGARSSVKKERGPGWSLAETVVGGGVRLSGMNRASTGVSYFIGNNPARWRSDVPTYESVSLGEIWPGISLELRAHGNNVEKVFTVEPGANPSRIRMNMAGARGLRTDRSGALIAFTGLGEVTFTSPAAYQERHGVRHAVRVAYELRGRQYGFRLDGYDPLLPVVIDPLLQATYLGGSGDELRNLILAFATHPMSGDVYVAGTTDSLDFPGTAGGAQPAFGGGTTDAFVARLNADLTTLIQATYLGGSRMVDTAFGLAIHPTSGDVYVAGFTDSTDFPGTAGGAQPVFGGRQDGFIARLNAGLTTLKQATYVGGSGDDYPLGGLAIHPASGEVYVAGLTGSTDLPGTAGGAQPANAGDLDAFVERLNEGLTTLVQATYLGGSATEEGFDLAICPASGDVYVSGFTRSTNFPGTAGGAQPASGGNADAFVARLNAGLTTLEQATYLGGSGDESESSIEKTLSLHPASCDVYLAGRTHSTDFPGTAGGAQPVFGGGDLDGYIAHLNAGLTALDQATYLGGTGDDAIRGLAIHPTSGEVYVTGSTLSTDFPGTSGGAQPGSGGGRDAFVARLNADLTALHQATYLGGSGDDLSYRLGFVPASGDVYVAGHTSSTDFPGTAGGAQSANGGGFDAFVARLTADLAGGASRMLTALSPAKVWVGLRNSDDVGLRLDLLAEVLVNSTKVGEGQQNNVSAGSSGFNNAILNTVPLGLTGGPVPVQTADRLKLRISVRRTCFGGGHNSGTVRLWYNGQPIDGGNARDAGTRFDATIDASTSDYFARENFALSTVAGSSRLSIDRAANSSSPCPNRPFTEFGTWSLTLP